MSKNEISKSSQQSDESQSLAQSLVKVGGIVLVLTAKKKQCCVVAESVGTRFTAHMRLKGRVANSQRVVFRDKNRSSMVPVGSQRQEDDPIYET